MSVEVRRVPLDWLHPRDAALRFRPLLAAEFATALAAWDAGQMKWDCGLIASHAENIGAPAWRPRDCWVRASSYEEHAGPRPRAEAYMPTWPPAERVGWQMYETITAGTPISPPCQSPEALAVWLADNNAIIGPGFKATTEEWLNMICGSGKAPMFMMKRGLPESPIQTLRPPAYVRIWRRICGTPAYD